MAILETALDVHVNRVTCIMQMRCRHKTLESILAPVIGCRDTHFVAWTVKHFNTDSDSNQTVAILEMGMNGLRQPFMNQLPGKRVREVTQLHSITPSSSLN